MRCIFDYLSVLVANGYGIPMFLVDRRTAPYFAMEYYVIRSLQQVKITHLLSGILIIL